MTDLLTDIFERQAALQRETYGQDLADLSTEEAISAIKTNVLAATDELHELLGETGWKPWATSRHINLDSARSELVDVLHFVVNLGLVLGMTPESLHTGYLAKRAKNVARQEAGYDGIATKCPGCKRALDDDGVLCEYEDGDGWFCYQLNRYIDTREDA